MDRYLGFIFLLALLTSCYKDNKEDLYANLEQDSCNTADVTYSADISAIINNSCAISGCHNSQVRQSGLNLADFTDLENIANDGRLVGRITGSGGPIMPPTGSLQACDIDKIENWVAGGALNN